MAFPNGERVVSGVERWAGWITLLCVLGTCVCLAGLVYLQVRVQSQASEGLRARTTQCEREPVIRKLVIAGAKYRLLTGEDVDRFRSTAPRGCPAPSSTP